MAGSRNDSADRVKLHVLKFETPKRNGDPPTLPSIAVKAARLQALRPGAADVFEGMIDELLAEVGA
jgi:hypothetical protein